MRYWLLSILLLTSINIFGQSTITGHIIDQKSNKSIAGSPIIVYKNGNPLHMIESDEDGTFNIKDVSSGSYTLMVTDPSYHIYSRELSMPKDHNLGEIALEPTTMVMEEIEVKGKRRETIYKLDSKMVSAASNLVASAGGNATDILARVPSIRVDLEGDVTFRGSSGFIIQINGKPSIYDSAQALRQIPASQIENIEIITTPSSRNQSDGDAGIINIITKRDYKEDFTGMINAYGSVAGSRGVDFMLNKRFGEHIVKFGGVYGQQFLKSDFSQEKMTESDGEQITSISSGDRVGQYFNYTITLGWELQKENTDYYIDLLGGYDGTERTGDLLYDEQSGESLYHYTSQDYYLNDQTIYSGSGGFNHKFNREGHTLTGYIFYKYGGDSGETFRSDLMNMDGTRAQGHEALESEYRQTIEARLDYTVPYSESGRIEAGYNYNSYLEDGDYQMVYWNPDNSTFEYRDDIYNQFFFRRNINTLYLLANQSVGRFEFQAGVRAEHTNQQLECTIEGSNREVNKLEFFPSTHVGFSLGEKSKLTAAFSRRTNRPQLYYMEPYITFRDYFTAEIGNPDIRPEYINAYELSYQRDMKEGSTLQLALFHRSRRDKFERLRVPYSQPGITLDSMANVGNDYSTGVEGGYNLDVGSVWGFVVVGSLYYYKLDNKQPELGGESESSINYDFSLSNSFKIMKGLQAQLDGYFVGPTVSTQGRNDGYFYADLALRKELLKGQMSLDLTYKNFLNSASYASFIDTSSLMSHTYINPKYPVISLGLSYRFNNYKGENSKRDIGIFEGQTY